MIYRYKSAGYMNLNRKDEKKYEEILKNDYLGNKKGKTFVSSPNVYRPVGLIASIIF